MVREIDLDASEGYLKYTLTLAGVGFAFAQTRIGTLSDSFAGATLLGMPLAGLLLTVLIGLFGVASAFGIMAISAIAGAKNDAAGFKALTPNRRHAAVPAHRERRQARMASARRNFTVHLLLLIVGFIVAALVFVAEALHRSPDPQLCQSRVGEFRITYPCGGSPQDLFQDGVLTP